jgi:hypothetical protein
MTEPQAQPQEAELKPCPWCAAISDERDGWGYLVTHETGCYWTNIHGDPIGRVRVNFSEVEQWNTRADLPRATVDDKMIREALRPIRGCATDDQYVEVFERVTALVSTPRAEGELTVEAGCEHCTCTCDKCAPCGERE